nr:hypothetical protein BACT7_17990 [Tenacibaculum mesophilum]
MKTTINKLIMKNLLLLISVVTLISCSSNNEMTEATTILGTWKLISHSDFTQVPDCMKQTNITFIEQGKLSGEIYEFNAGDCDKNNLVASYEKETEISYKIMDNFNIISEVKLESNRLIWTEKSATKTRVLNFIRK